MENTFVKEYAFAKARQEFLSMMNSAIKELENDDFIYFANTIFNELEKSVHDGRIERKFYRMGYLLHVLDAIK